RFLYQIDSNIEGFGYEKDPRIDEILSTRGDKRSDIAYAIDCKPEQVSLTKDEALSGDIKFHLGELGLSSLTSAEGLTLPKSVCGDLGLSGLTSAEGLTLPGSVGGSLYLSGLTSAEGLRISRALKGRVITNIELPESVWV
ncbi:MAG: hypothetical protein ABIA47_03620, partial [bacterium]